MRILVVSNLYPPDVIGGYEVACSQITEHLRGRGHDVTVLTTTAHLPIERAGDELRALRFEDVGDRYLFAHRDPRGHRLAMSRAMLVDGHNVACLRAAIERCDPDVVYLWNLVGIGGLALALAVDLCGLPWAWHLMDGGPRDLAAGADTGSRTAGRAIAARLRGTYLACSQRLVDDIAEVCGPLGDRVEVVPCWITGDVPLARARWWLRGDTLRCISAGRLAPEKHVDVAIEAVHRLCADGASVRFDIWGDGPERDRLEAIAAAGPGRDAISFSGNRPQAALFDALLERDLFLFPTWVREPFAFAPLEATSRGCVPIVTPGSGNAEWFTHGEDLLLAPPTEAGLAGALQQVVAGEHDLAAIARRGQARVWDELHIDRIGRRIEELLATTSTTEARRARVPWDHIERLALLADRVAQVVVAQT